MMATFTLARRHKLEQNSRRLPKEAWSGDLRESLRQKGPRHLTILQLINRDGPDCYLCGEALRPDGFEVDHIIARSLGGSDHPLNLALACRQCNARKRDLIVSFDVADRRPVFRLP